MKALYFTKMDHMRAKPQLLLFPAGLVLMVAIMLFEKTDGWNSITLFLYELFFAIVSCTAPFGMCRREDAGFLMLLPATTRDRVVGRFLYGISLMLFAAVFGGIAMMGNVIALGYSYTPIELVICLIGFSVGILIMTVEYVFLYLFGENQGQQVINLIRVLPGMCYFFVGINLASRLTAHPERVADAIMFMLSHLETIGIVSVAAALIVPVAAIVLCVKVTEKKDY